jgi:hypothetical protein
MAHYAQLDDQNTVINVLVVANSQITNPQGQEDEKLGIGFLRQLFGHDTSWAQTSYNGNFRKNYAGIGYTYDATRDAFIPPQPYPSWVLDEDICQWRAPVPMPEEGGPYVWDERTLSWQASQAPVAASGQAP